MSMRALGRAVILLLALPVCAQAAPLRYLMVDYGPFPPTKSLAYLDFYDDKVSGWLEHEDKSRVSLHGTNSIVGHMSLSFDTTPPYEIEFVKQIEGDQITWRSVGDGQTVIVRPRSGSINEQAHLLTQAGCGPDYGTLDVSTDGMERSRLVRAMASHEYLALIDGKYFDEKLYSTLGSPEQFYDAFTPAASLAEAVVEAFDRETSLVQVEIGSEASAIEALQAVGLNAHLWLGECGSSEAAELLVGKSTFFEEGRFQERKFVDFASTNMLAFLDSGGFDRDGDHRLSNPTVSVMRVPPYSVSVRFDVTAPAELTRGGAGEWDRFSVSFNPANIAWLAEGEYAVVITVEQLTTAKRSLGSGRAPGPDYFTRGEPNFPAEAAVTQSILTSFESSKEVIGSHLRKF